MSVERWNEGRERPVRLPVCGHVLGRSELKRSGMNCLICGWSFPGFGERTKADCVPSLTLTWDGAERDNCTSCEDMMYSGQRDSVPFIEVFLWKLSTKGVWSVDLGSQTIFCVSPSPPIATSHFHVWRASPTGCHVKAGTVNLPTQDIMLLDGRGANFHGTSFKGGSLVLAGPASSSSLIECTFDCCTLYAVHGASVALRRCRLANSQCGAIVHGAGTTAVFHACEFSHCTNSIIVEKGATATVRACEFDRTAVALIASDPGARGTVIDCWLNARKRKDDSRVTSFSCGAVAWGGCVSLSRCHLIGFMVASCDGALSQRKNFTDGATILVDRCRIDGGHGVGVNTRARVCVRQCHIDAIAAACDVRDTLGTVFTGGRAGALLWLERCCVHGAAECEDSTAVDVMGTGRAALLLCVLRCGATAVRFGGVSQGHMRGCWASGGEMCCHATTTSGKGLLMSECRLKGAPHALCAVGKVSVVAVDTLMRGRVAALGRPEQLLGVLHVTGGGVVKMFRCSVRDGRNGVVAIASEVEAKDTHVANLFVLFRGVAGKASPHQGIGYVCDKSTVTIVGGNVMECSVGVLGVGSGREADKQRCAVNMRGVVFCREAEGLSLSGGCEADVQDCEFRGGDRGHCYVGSQAWIPSVQSAVVLWHAKHVRLRGCSFNHFMQGVKAGHVPGLQILNCSFRCCEADRFCLKLTDCGGAVVEDCSFAGLGAGIEASSSRAVVQRCSFQEAVACGMSAEDSSKLRVLDCQFSKCVVGVDVSGSADVNMSDCVLLQMQRGVVMETGGHIAASKCKLSGGSVLVEAMRHYGSSTKSEATLTDCQLSNAGTGVRVWGAGAAATLQRCNISGCDVGLYMADAVAVRVADCDISRCDWGMLVGLNQMDLLDRCGACGKEGQRAWDAARQFLASARKSHSGESTGQCAHHGAVARLCAERVDVRHCKRGVRVNEFGLLDAVGLRVHKCAQGVCVVHIERRSGECSTFRECVAEACGEGSNVMRVWPRGVVEEACCTEGDVRGLAVRRAKGAALIAL